MSDSNFRSPEENDARSRCRLIARDLGSRLMKVKRTHVSVTPNGLWPDGLITIFNGWQDLEGRLRFCTTEPDNVTDGVYIYDADASFEIESASRIQKYLEENPIDPPVLVLGLRVG